MRIGSELRRLACWKQIYPLSCSILHHGVKNCTDLDLNLLYNLRLGTYMIFARKNKICEHGARRPPSQCSLADRLSMLRDWQVMLTQQFGKSVWSAPWCSSNGTKKLTFRVFVERCLLITESPQTPSHCRYQIWVLGYIPYTGLAVFSLRFLVFLCIQRFRIFKVRVLNASE